MGINLGLQPSSGSLRFELLSHAVEPVVIVVADVERRCYTAHLVLITEESLLYEIPISLVCMVECRVLRV